jgi:DNA-binding NarL/FixJ family response regulator
VAEGHPGIRLGLKILVEGQSEIDIVAETETAAGALHLTDRVGPDVVVVDAALLDRPGRAACAEIRTRHPSVAIVALTMHEDLQYVNMILSAGASDLVSKRTAPKELLKAIRRAVTSAGPAQGLEPGRAPGAEPSLGTTPVEAGIPRFQEQAIGG